MVNVPLYINYGRYAQQADANINSMKQVLKGGMPVQKYVRLLFIVRRAVEWMYGMNPTDSSLDQTANYLFALSGSRNLTVQSPTTPFVIVVQPQSQSVNQGDNVVFTVQAAGGIVPYVYQWYFNLIPLVGEEADTLSLTSVDGSNSGDYYCVVTDNNGSGTILQSDNASLTVIPAAITGYLSYGDVDPNTDLQAHVDNFTYQTSYGITHNAPISVPIPQAASNNKYLIVKVPSTESDKTIWYSTSFSNGTVPDFVFQSMITFGGWDFYYTRNASSFDYTVPIIFS